MDVEAEELDQIAGATGTAVEEARPVSLLRDAEERRKSRKNHLFLDVPSWGGDLIGEYNPVGRNDLEAMIRKSAHEARANGGSSSGRTKADMDIIIRACCGIWVRDEENGQEIECAGDLVVKALPLEVAGIPATYSTVNEHLKNPGVNSAREMVLYLFGGGQPGTDPGLPISAHALTIARYMRDPSKDPLANQE